MMQQRKTAQGIQGIGGAAQRSGAGSAPSSG
jgi:hypothetical protein